MAPLTTGNGLPDVVVTGVAMTTALAVDAENTWKKLLDGQSGIRLLDDPFVEEYDLPVRIGGHLQCARPESFSSVLSCLSRFPSTRVQTRAAKRARPKTAENAVCPVPRAV